MIDGLNQNVDVLGRQFHVQTEVIIGVGPQRARWRCIGYGDGTTTVVMSLAEEGRL